MKLMISLLVAGALLVGGLYYRQAHQDRCTQAGFGIMGSVAYCTRPDGSVYLKNPPALPTPQGTSDAPGQG